MYLKNFLTKKRNLIFFCFFLNFISFIIWIIRYKDYIPLYDQLSYLILEKETFENILRGDVKPLLEFYGGGGKFPNSKLPFILFIPIYFLFDFSTYFYLLLNLLSVNLSCFLIYKICKKMFDEDTGILATFIFSTFQAVYWFSKFFF